MNRTDRFAEYLREQALAAGYPVARRHGRNTLARDAGMTRTDVARALAGQRIPEPNELERLADALGLSLMRLLVDSGIVRPNREARP